MKNDTSTSPTPACPHCGSRDCGPFNALLRPKFSGHTHGCEDCLHVWTPAPSAPAQPVAAHTPGPWRAEESQDDGRIVVQAGSLTVCCVGADVDAAWADARLIASAPALLAERDALRAFAESVVLLGLSDAVKHPAVARIVTLAGKALEIRG